MANILSSSSGKNYIIQEADSGQTYQILDENQQNNNNQITQSFAKTNNKTNNTINKKDEKGTMNIQQDLQTDPYQTLSEIEKMFIYKKPRPKIVRQVKAYPKNDPWNYQKPEETTNNIITSNEYSIRSEKEIVRQFGYDFFSNQKNVTNFIVTDIPVGPDYILGPGDMLVINIWGRIEKKLELTIDRNGKIFISEIGELSLWQKKLSDAQKIIRTLLERQYTNFEMSVTLGKLRTIKVFVLGDIANPGAYDMTAVATAYQALYAAGGPKKTGSMRHIKLIRDHRTISKIDLYRYLLSGDNSQDPSLKEGDTVFVEPIGDVVKIDGMVNRPGIYEITSETNLQNIIALAGGVIANAYIKRIQLERITENEYRSILDRSFGSIEELQKNKPNYEIQNGDSISISEISKDLKNYVYLKGVVIRPGLFEYKKGLTLGQIIDKAEGLGPLAYQNRIEIYRNGDELIPLDYTQTENTQFLLKEFDIIRIYSKKEIKGDQYIYIEGAIKNPGKYKLYQNMKLKDLLFNAKTETFSNLKNIEIYRTLAGKPSELITLNLSDENTSNNIFLEEEDHVFIRYETEGFGVKKIYLTGEFKYPGLYLARTDEKLGSIIQRAGGFTAKAFIPGAVFTRISVKNQMEVGQNKVLEAERKRIIYDQRLPQNKSQVIEYLSQKIDESKGRLVINLDKIVANEDTQYNLIIEDGDALYIPQIPATVQVIGGVQHQSSFLYLEEDNHASYYIAQAGNYTEYADPGNAFILKANGSISKNLSRIERGDTIYIPEKIIERIDIVDTIAKISQTMFNVITTWKLTKELLTLFN